MRRERKPVPQQFRHKIVPTSTGFELRTYYGYVLKAFTMLDDARAYYSLHCPEI